MHDVRAQLANEAREQQWVEVARRANAYGRHPQRVVEVVGAPRWIVEADEHGLDAALGERGQEREQVSLGAADTADAVDVDDLHRARNRWMTCSIVRGGEEREQEVPRDPVPRGADEGKSRGRLVGEQQQREPDERTRREEEADCRERVERPHVRRLGHTAADVELRAGATAVARLEDGRLPEQLRRKGGELDLVAWMLAYPIDRTVLVEAHLEALVRMQRPTVAQPDAVCLLGRQPARSGRTGRMPADVVDPLARAQQAVRARVVRLPQRASVRRQREAADAHLVTDEPRRDGDRCACENQSGDERGRARAR